MRDNKQPSIALEQWVAERTGPESPPWWTGHRIGRHWDRIQLYVLSVGLYRRNHVQKQDTPSRKVCGRRIAQPEEHRTDDNTLQNKSTVIQISNAIRIMYRICDSAYASWITSANQKPRMIWTLLTINARTCIGMDVINELFFRVCFAYSARLLSMNWTFLSSLPTQWSL